LSLKYNYGNFFFKLFNPLRPPSKLSFLTEFAARHASTFLGVTLHDDIPIMTIWFYFVGSLSAKDLNTKLKIFINICTYSNISWCHQLWCHQKTNQILFYEMFGNIQIQNGSKQ